MAFYGNLYSCPIVLRQSTGVYILGTKLYSYDVYSSLLRLYRNFLISWCWQRCLGFRPDIDKSPDFSRNQGLRLELSQKGPNPLSYYWSFQHKFLRFCQHSLVLAIQITKVISVIFTRIWWEILKISTSESERDQTRICPQISARTSWVCN